MPSQSILTWQDGRGWLVLAGSENSALRATVLARSTTDGGIAVVWAAGDVDAGEDQLDDFEELGAPSGYLVDVLSEPDDLLKAQLADAGIVVICDGEHVEQLRSGLVGAAIEGIKTAFSNGGVVLAEGKSASLLGTWLLQDDKTLSNGLGWVTHGLVLGEGVISGDQLKALLLQYSSAVAIRISPGSALALGPDGEVELWGDQQVTITLGADYHSN